MGGRYPLHGTRVVPVRVRIVPMRKQGIWVWAHGRTQGVRERVRLGDEWFGHPRRPVVPTSTTTRAKASTTHGDLLIFGGFSRGKKGTELGTKVAEHPHK